MSVNTKIDGLALREAKRALRSNVDRRSQPRRSIASGYVATIHEDASGKIVAASVKSSGSTIRVQVPYGQNIYVGMTVQIENYGSHSQASWAISGSASLPAGTSGGIVYNQNGSNVLMFDNIWVVDGGFIRAGGTEDPDGNPTGSRTEMTELGFFGWDAYDRRMLGIFTRDEAPIGDDDPFITGDAYIGYMDGGRFQVSAQNQRMGIYNGDEVILQFDPETGNRITKNLWVGDDAGPQVGIGKWSVGGEDTSILVARNAGSGDMNAIGNEPVWMVSAAPGRVTVHTGDPDHSENYMFYDSSYDNGEGQPPGRFTVDALLNARAINIYGPGLIADGGYIGAEATGTSLAGIWLRPKYQEGRGNAGDRTFLFAAATVTLDKHPYDSSYGAITWSGGEGYIGDILHQHWRWDVRGANGNAGMYYGDDPKVYFDPQGNAVLDGTLYAWDGEVVVGRDGRGIELALPAGGIDNIKTLVSFVNDIDDPHFQAGFWASADTTAVSEVSETLSDRINVSLGTFANASTLGKKSWVRIISNAATSKEAGMRLQAAGDNGSASQAIIDLWSLRGDDGTHGRIDLNAPVVRLFQTTAAPVATTGQPLNNYLIAVPDGTTWNPHTYVGGQYMVARLGAEWRPFAQAWGTTQRFGAATTNYSEIDAFGTMTFAGSARIIPRWLTFTKSGSFTADESEATSYRCGTSGAAATVTLPAASASNKGIPFTFRKVTDDTYTVTISGVNPSDVVLRARGDHCTVESNGSLWEVTNRSDLGYTLHFFSTVTSILGDGATFYFGNLASAAITTANILTVRVPRSGQITAAEVYSYAATAGSNENWSMYVRVNGTTDTLIQTVGSATNARRWTNTGLGIDVVAGDYIEIKMVNPTWATNPANALFSANLYIR